jgi:hypothetical protein
MGAIGNAWQAASRRQKITIGVALLIAVSGVAALTNPPDNQPPALARATATPSASVASVVPSAAAATETQAPTEVATATPNPTAAPTARVTTAPTPRPTPVPTPRPTMTLTFTSLTSPIHRGSYATATVKTKPGAACSIIVEYKSGASTAAGLGPKTASGSGVASWTWKVGTNTTPGSWPVTVTCASGGLRKSVTRYLQVV